MIHPKIQEQLELAAKLALVPGLQELKMQGEDVQAFLSPETETFWTTLRPSRMTRELGQSACRNFSTCSRGCTWIGIASMAMPCRGMGFRSSSPLASHSTTGEDVVNIILDRV